MYSCIAILIFCALCCGCTVSNEIDNLLENVSVETEEVQKSHVVTKGNIVSFYYQWTIENFSYFYKNVAKQTTIKSPAFSMRADFSNEYQWFLWLIVENNNGVKLYPYLVSEVNNKLLYDNNINTKYTFGILDGNRETFVEGPYQGVFRSESDMHGITDEWNFSEIVKQNDTLVIFCKGESNIPSSYSEKDSELSNLKSLNPTLQYKYLDHTMLQEILHFVYTGKTTNTKKLHHSLLVAFDILELTEILEENLFSKLNIETAAEIYKFTYLHEKAELKKRAINFIKKNALQVMNTKGWKLILDSSNPGMLAEIFSSFATSLETENNTTDGYAIQN